MPLHHLLLPLSWVTRIAHIYHTKGHGWTNQDPLRGYGCLAIPAFNSYAIRLSKGGIHWASMTMRNMFQQYEKARQAGTADYQGTDKILWSRRCPQECQLTIPALEDYFSELIESSKELNATNCNGS